MGTEVIRDLHDRPKWFTKGPLTFGWAGGARAAQVVEHGISFRAKHRGESDLKYLVNAVSKAIHNGLKEAGTRLHSGGESGEDTTTFLIVYRGRLYTVQDDYSVIRSPHGFASIGVGADIALGAMSALKSRVTPEECVREALEHSARWCSQVSPPLYVAFFH